MSAVVIGWIAGGGARRQLRDQLEQLERPTSPLTALSPHADAPRGVHWVEPQVVVDVEFRELSKAGGLRHSSYKGRRSDIAPEDATCDLLP